MRLCNRLSIFAFLTLLGIPAQAQVKDMPTQAEFDPILENADSKVKDFLTTLTKYRVEASEIDKERLEKDLRDFRQLRELIQIAHSGRGNHGFNLGRIFLVLITLDDASIEAAVWSNLLTARICSQPKQSLLEFGLAVQDNGGILREVSSQLLHPATRLMDAADDMLLALADVAKKRN